MPRVEPAMFGPRLRSLVPDCSMALGADDVAVTSCSSDSRQCQPGDLFFAMVGAEADGHYFVDEAIQRGATAIVAERVVPTGGVPLFVVDDVRQAYGTVCQHLVGNPSRQLRVIGVTGTSGKSTTVELIRSVLEAGDFRTGTIGTLGCYNGEAQAMLSASTTPSPPQLAIQLAKMAANGCTHAVIEADSRSLSQSRMAGIQLDAACITNIRRDHIDYHNSVENYRRAKTKMLDYLTPEGLTVLNVDDPTSTKLLSHINGPVLTIGTGETAQIAAILTEQFRSEQTFLLLAGEDTAVVRTRIIGLHHVYNCLAAAAMGLSYGLDLTTIVRGLERVESLPRRMERIECGQPFGVFVDCAQSADSLAHCLEALRAVTSGRVICVLGPEPAHTRDHHLRSAAICQQNADAVVLTSDAGGVATGQALRAMHREFSDMEDVLVEANRQRAIHSALAMAEEGDTVLVAGSADTATQNYFGGTTRIDDCEVVRDWIYQVVQAMPLRRAA